MYHPALGRFIARDPIGYADGWNLYEAYFVPNNIDPSGKHVTFIPEDLGKNPQYVDLDPDTLGETKIHVTIECKPKKMRFLRRG